MDYSRLFISLPIEAAVITDILKGFKKLDLPWEKLKLAKAEQIHLTLKFLGDTSISRIPELIEILQNVNSKVEYLELAIDGPVIFNNRIPKVLALKIKDNKNLNKLFEEIEEKLFSAGLANKEVRKFSAHITLARVKQSAKYEEFKNFISWPIHKTSSSTYFELKESVLSKKGPEHTTLQTFDL